MNKSHTIPELHVEHPIIMRFVITISNISFLNNFILNYRPTILVQ